MRSLKIAAVLFTAILSMGVGSYAAAATTDAAIGQLNQERYTQELTDITDEDQRRDTLCLALNLYHEIRGNRHNERAVAAVGWATRNRVESPVANGRSYCGIIWERNNGKPQFSWTIKSADAMRPREIQEWNRMVRIARRVMDGSISDPTNGANTFYISTLGTPRWTAGGTGRIAVGPHTFVRLRNR